MLIETERIIPVTKLQKELTKRVKEVSQSGEPLYIFKNNDFEATLVSAEEYQYYSALDEIFEQFEIKSMLDERLSTYDSTHNKSWDSIREDI